MRRLALLLVLPLLLASCGERDPKALTDSASEAFQARDYKTSLTGFEQALTQMDAAHAQYMRAALGRCLALAHVDPAKGKDEFFKLARAEKARIETADVHLIVSEFVKVGEFALATDIMEGVNSILPKSEALQELGDSVADAALNAGDTKTSNRLQGLGYVGSAARPKRKPPK